MKPFEFYVRETPHIRYVAYGFEQVERRGSGYRIIPMIPITVFEVHIIPRVYRLKPFLLPVKCKCHRKWYIMINDILMVLDIQFGSEIFGYEFWYRSDIEFGVPYQIIWNRQCEYQNQSDLGIECFRMKFSGCTSFWNVLVQNIWLSKSLCNEFRSNQLWLKGFLLSILRIKLLLWLKFQQNSRAHNF